MKIIVYIVIFLTLVSPMLHAQQADERRLVLVMMDGMRWQDVFDGADTAYVFDRRFVADPAALAQLFVRDSQEARRTALMPFLWERVQTDGLIIGNRWAACPMSVANNHWYSYPGYSEVLCGHADDRRIASNEAVDNPNISVLEVANDAPAYRGSVMAYATWGVVRHILNTRRSGIPCVAGSRDRAQEPWLTERMSLLNTMKDTMGGDWGDATRDTITAAYALEAMRRFHPKVLYVALAETDEHAHKGRYDRYLMAAHVADDILRQLWQQAQADPFYRARTTFVVATDHGRGQGDQWTDHGALSERSGETWLAAFGPGIPHLAMVVGAGPFTNSQIAATIARLLGVPFQPDGQPVAPPLFFAE